MNLSDFWAVAIDRRRWGATKRCASPKRVTAVRALRTAALVATVSLAVAPAASAQINAAVSVQTTGGTRVVVKLTSTTRLPANQRLRTVSVRVSGTTFRLSRAAGASAVAVGLGTWRSSVLKGTSAAKALALSGKRVTVLIGLGRGSVTLHSTVAAAQTGTSGLGAPSGGTPSGGTPNNGPPGTPSGGTPGSTSPTPLFAPPGQELTGQAAFNSFKQYFLNAEFSDCPAGHWPTCAVENRYEHAPSGSFEYHRCTPTSGSDINFYDSYQITGAAQHANGAWVVEYTDQNGAGFYHWEVGTDGTVAGYYQYNAGAPEALTGYYWRQPAHLGDCYS